MIAGYTSERPLSELDRRVIPICVAARYAQVNDFKKSLKKERIEATFPNQGSVALGGRGEEEPRQRVPPCERGGGLAEAQEALGVRGERNKNAGGGARDRKRKGAGRKLRSDGACFSRFVVRR